MGRSINYIYICCNFVQEKSPISEALFCYKLLNFKIILDQDLLQVPYRKIRAELSS